jgi:hypothetical protein
MTTKNFSRQAGSVHMITIVILVFVLLGGLGFVFWKNFISKPNTVDTNEKSSAKKEKIPTKKSEIIVQSNSDMNRYVNHEEGFEFSFPKIAEAPAKCVTKSTVYDTYGKEVPSRSYYATVIGAADMGVLEGDGRYIVAPEETFVLSDITYDGSYDLAGACSKQPATIELIDFANDLNKDKRVENTIKREFDIIQADNMEAITTFVRKTLGDTQATATLGALEEGRQKITFNYGPGIHMGMVGYNAWYYPARKKLVYMNMGQNVVLLSPTTLGLYYDDKVANSFKFTD